MYPQPGNSNTTGVVHTAAPMAESRWRIVRDRSLFAGLIVVMLNVSSVLVGWLGGNPPAFAATRSLALTSQFIASPWLRRILGAGGYEATTTGALTGLISTVLLLAALTIVALVLLYRVESPQVLLVPSVILTLGAAIILIVRLAQPGPVSLAGVVLLVVIGLMSLRTVLSVLVWMNEQHIDGAVGDKRALRRFRSSDRRGTGYHRSVEKLEDTQLGIASAVALLALVIGPFVGERLWGGEAQSIIPVVGPDLADKLHLGSIFASGFVVTYWIGGAMVVLAWGALALLGPPWRGRRGIIAPSLAILLLCSFFLFNGTFDRQVTHAAQTILTESGAEIPLTKQLSEACLWFAKGRRARITLAVAKPACNEVDVYKGDKIEGTIPLPGAIDPTLGGTYRDGPVVAQLKEPNDSGTLQRLVGLNWLGGVNWTYDCPGGAALGVVEFVGSGAGSSSVTNDPTRQNFDRREVRYIVVTCGDEGTKHYISGNNGQELR